MPIFQIPSICPSSLWAYLVKDVNGTLKHSCNLSSCNFYEVQKNRKDEAKKPI